MSVIQKDEFHELHYYVLILITMKRKEVIFLRTIQPYY